MNLEFIELRLQGFKQFIKPVIFALSASGGGLVLMRGRNEVEPALGANDVGKSSLFDALTWCLFGRTVDNLHSTDLRSWQEAPPLQVEVTVAIAAANGDGSKVHKIARGRRLTLDGAPVGQDQITRLLRLNFDVFANTVLLGQGRPLFFDLEPRNKMELFSAALELERWEVRSEAAAWEVETMEKKLQREKETQGSIKATLEQAQKLLEDTKRRSQEWETQRKERIAKNRQAAEELEKQLEPLRRQRDDADLAYDGAETEYKAQARAVADLEKLVTVTTTSYARAEAAAKKCPTCGQPIKADVPAKYKAAKESAESDLAHARKYAQTFRTKADAASATLHRLNPRVTELETKLRGLTNSHLEHEDEENPHRPQVGELQRCVQQHEANLAITEEVVGKVLAQIARTKVWVKGFKDIRLAIVEDVLQELQLATNALLPESGLQDWEVHYGIEQETKSGTIRRGLTVTVLSPYNDQPVRWESWGGGVGQRLRLIGALALSEVLLRHAGVGTNLEILDEPTQYFSPKGVEYMCEFLASRARTLDKNIVLVDHHAVESAQFSGVVTVVKTAAGSMVEG